MNEAVNSVNYTELVKYYSTKDGSSPKTLKKILDAKVEKSFNNLHQPGGIKLPLHRKADLWLLTRSSRNAVFFIDLSTKTPRLRSSKAAKTRHGRH